MNRERMRGRGGRTREDDVRGMQEEEEEEEEETAALESFIFVFTFTSSELDSPLPFLCLFSISLQLISFVLLHLVFSAFLSSFLILSSFLHSSLPLLRPPFIFCPYFLSLSLLFSCPYFCHCVFTSSPKSSLPLLSLQLPL